MVARDQSAAAPPSPVPSTGWLDLPGQPYGTYSICADYQFQNQGVSGSTTVASNFHKVTLNGRANTSFTAANSITVAMATTSGTGFC